MKNKTLDFFGKKFAKTVSTTLVLAMLVGTTVSAQTLSARDLFDANYYSKTYEDLSKAFGTDGEALYNHYVNYGQKEARTFTKLIDLKKYRAAYADLDAAFGDDWAAYLNHYINYGIAEGRNSFGVFDARAYADRYPDLKAAFGYDVLALYMHYMNFGMKEGRNCERAVEVSSASNSTGSCTDSSTSSNAGQSTATVETSGALVDPETGAPIANATVRFTRISDLYQQLAEQSVSGNDTVSGSDAGESTVSGGDAGEGTVSGGDAGESTVTVGDGWYEVTTDANGHFVIRNLPAGVYDVSATAPGYMTLTLGTVAVGSASGTYSMPIFELLSDSISGANDVTGRATDATTGLAMAGVTLKVRSGWRNYEGDVVATAVTDEDGTYSIRLERGYYTIEFAKEGYASSFVPVFSSNASRNFQGVLNPASASVVEDTQLRVVLTWGQIPNDLDSHLVGNADNERGYYHVYFGDKTYYVGEELIASLDVDDVDREGPETVTVFEVQNDENYYYSVHDYSNRNKTDSTVMSASGANVKVYRGSTLEKEYNVPTGKTGNVWNVFKIVDGQIIDVNEYSSEYSTIFGDYTLD